MIAGADEAGRGPLAGPVVGAVVVFRKGYRNPRIKDSKQLCAAEREYLSAHIRKVAVAWAVVAVGHERIEQINIREASRHAMSLALSRITRVVIPDVVWIDGNMELKTDLPQKTFVGGDGLKVQISAASILAKVWRDSLMKNLDHKYPGYGFAQHAGYPTEYHRERIACRGPCRVHRRSFRGVSQYVQKRAPQLLAPEMVSAPA